MSPESRRIAAYSPRTSTRSRPFSGTSAIASTRPRARYLNGGDVVESRIATPDGAIDLGLQRNRIVVEAA
ncbi:hypothetical protein [Roseiarcus fermentans]|uniref:hypothetical protein n=1 Tax=Roseiarcus fermentans TaxID=1473586 RepID=UPI000DEB3792|nr:hypothetical protein [Roseiarcus fermentans]